jgi:hypothetical protein
MSSPKNIVVRLNCDSGETIKPCEKFEWTLYQDGKKRDHAYAKHGVATVVVVNNRPYKLSIEKKGYVGIELVFSISEIRDTIQMTMAKQRVIY